MTKIIGLTFSHWSLVLVRMFYGNGLDYGTYPRIGTKDVDHGSRIVKSCRSV